jgi:hypothetical protein
MCHLASHPISEVLARYGDGRVYVATLRACGCTDLRAARITDLSRGLALLDAEQDTEADTEPAEHLSAA